VIVAGFLALVLGFAAPSVCYGLVWIVSKMLSQTMRRKAQSEYRALVMFLCSFIGIFFVSVFLVMLARAYSTAGPIIAVGFIVGVVIARIRSVIGVR
jgi:hypothetical protein